MQWTSQASCNISEVTECQQKHISARLNLFTNTNDATGFRLSN